MKSYVVNCVVRASDNDYLKMTEVRAAEQTVPVLVAGIRALIGGQLETLLISGDNQAVSITAQSGVFVLRISNQREQFSVTAAQLEHIEAFLLRRMFQISKSGTSTAVQRKAETGTEVSLGFRVE